MKHFILTSPKFDGSIVYKYDDAGYLIEFKYDAEMNLKQREHILTKMPLTLAGFNDVLGTSETAKIEEVPHDLSFDAFWDAYEKKINRKRSEPLWKKMKDSEKMLCLKSLKPYNRYLKRTGFRNKKDPDNYLRDELYSVDWDKEK